VKPEDCIFSDSTVAGNVLRSRGGKTNKQQDLTSGTLYLNIVLRVYLVSRIDKEVKTAGPCGRHLEIRKVTERRVVNCLLKKCVLSHENQSLVLN
jgi:hypothetical protein